MVFVVLTVSLPLSKASHPPPPPPGSERGGRGLPRRDSHEEETPRSAGE